MKTIEEIWSIVNGLKELYPDGVCSLDYRKDYELLFSVRLAARKIPIRISTLSAILFTCRAIQTVLSTGIRMMIR